MIRNLRDLGGLIGAGGKKVKKNMLIRSANLSTVDDADIAWMREINLTRIIDLRTPTEVSHRADVMIPGISYENFYLQDEDNVHGVTVKGIRALMMSSVSNEERMALVPDMRALYANMVTDDYSRNRFAELIRGIVKYDKGAQLFHCTSGKDRTGMTAAILYTILGVAREDIFEDYLRSLEHAEWESAIMRDQFIDEGASPELADKLKQFFMLDRDFLETFFYEIVKLSGNVENYIKDVIGLSDQDIEEYRNEMLE